MNPTGVVVVAASAIRTRLVANGRVVILGAPRTGKSTLQRKAGFDYPQLCTDPEHLVKEPREGVEYVPEDNGGWSEASQYVADHFLTRAGPWVLEGVGAARALRKWRDAHPGEEPPCELLVWVQNPPWVKHKRGQAAMGKGIHTVMKELREWLQPVTWIVRLDED